MKGYKAFKKGLICDPTGKNPCQYEENSIKEFDEAKICHSGAHFCKYPLDVLEYYPLVDDNGDMTEFAEVEALDEPITDDNKKFCTKKIKIGAKISFADLVNASINFEKDVKETRAKTTSKDSAQIGSSGNSAKIGSSGNSAKIGSSGNSAQIGSSGNSAKIGSSGYYAQIGSSGDYAQINSTGKNAVVMCAGNESIAKAKIGSWITLSEWKWIDGVYTPVCVKTEKVDGERIKEDTYYKLVNGEFVEVEK